MGEHNVIAGRVVSVDGDAVRFDVPGGASLLASPAKRPEVGASIAIAVRADKIVLGEGDAGRGFTALVSAVEYRGATVHVSVSAPGLDEFAVSIDEAKFFQTPLAVGDAVPLSWSAGGVHVLG
jgi:putative spermidine/putrescine transport system ATP-binding protein